MNKGGNCRFHVSYKHSSFKKQRTNAFKKQRTNAFKKQRKGLVTCA